MKILFLSRSAATRGAIAQGLARQMFGDSIEAQCAGLNPARTHALALAVMREVNIDISDHSARPVQGLDMAGYDLVVLLGIDRELAEVARAAKRRLQWPLPDPFDPPAAEAELLSRLRELRTALGKHLKALGRMRDKAL